MIPIPATYWPWIKVALWATVCAAFYIYGGSNAKARCERASLAVQNKALVGAVAERDKAIADRNEAQRKADNLAKLPAKVVTVVRQNPSGCSIARPVTDSVREQVRQTNDAIRTAPVP